MLSEFMYIALMSSAKFKFQMARSQHFWIESLIWRFPFVSIEFWGCDGLKDTSFVYRRAEPLVNDTSMYTLGSKWYRSMEHFLFNTSCDWYLRATHDVFINEESFEKFTSSILAEYEPREEIIILGNVVDNRYLQGGSGFLMSRRAVEHIMMNWNSLFDKFSVHKEDDLAFGEWMSERGLLEGANSLFFVGHSFVPYQVSDVRFGKTGFYKCPDGRSLGRVKDLLVIHQQEQRFVSHHRIVMRNCLRSDNDLWWYQDGLSPKVCTLGS